MRSSSAPLICFEGPIAAGKTTLATLLGRHLTYGVELERFSENPFLADFYGDRSRWALPMQLWFLADRNAHLVDIAAKNTVPLVVDFSVAKNDVFSSLLLGGRELDLHSALSLRLSKLVRTPTLLVYLDAPNTVLLQRIASRGRAYERSIDEEYLNALRGSYERYLASHPEFKIFRFDSSTVDLGSLASLITFFESVVQRVR